MSMIKVSPIAEPVVPPPLLKLMVMPLTTIVSASTRYWSESRSSQPPDSKVVPVIATGTVKLLSRPYR